MTIRAPRPAAFADALERMGLQRDGDPILTAACVVGPVRRDGVPLFLKVTDEPEERAGSRALAVWDGHGAVRLVDADVDAFLLERGGATLRATVRDDGEATRALCHAAAELHSVPDVDLAPFPDLDRWYDALWRNTDNRFDLPRQLTRALIDDGAPPVLLHGDLHHENLLDLGVRGWLTIDPKGIAGPPVFDYCNIFTNWTLAEAVEHFDSRLAIVCTEAGFGRELLLSWIVSWSALSGIWHLEGGEVGPAEFPHTIMDLAIDRLH